MKTPKRGIDLCGKTFGLWTVLECAGKIGNSRHVWWKVQCGCVDKKIKNVVGTSLTSGQSQSCGCLVVEVGKRNRTHGMHGTPEYQAWLSAKKRTRDPSHPQYKDYGGRGIGMSDELYDSFPLFFAEIGFRPKQPPKRTVDRKNNNLGYIAGNLKWSTYKEQTLNRRDNRHLERNGVRKTHSEWDDEMGFPRGTVKNRVRIGWPVEKIFSTPVRFKTKKPRPDTGGV